MAVRETPKLKRGFAAMSPAKRRAIAKKGGLAVPKEKRAFAVDPSLAASAGSKGGRARSDNAHLSREEAGANRKRKSVVSAPTRNRTKTSATRK